MTNSKVRVNREQLLANYCVKNSKEKSGGKASSAAASSVLMLIRNQHFVTPWTVAHQAPPSVGFSRQEYWSGLPFPPPGESSRPRDRTCIPCMCKWILYHLATQETP